MAKIETFHDLFVWQKAHLLVLGVYTQTKNFPPEEKYSLVQQLRRAVVSIASNIVEGFNRLTIKESLRFYNISKASLEEVKYQLLIAKDLDYFSDKHYEETIKSCNEVGRLLNYWVQNQIKNTKKVIHTYP